MMRLVGEPSVNRNGIRRYGLLLIFSASHGHRVKPAHPGLMDVQNNDALLECNNYTKGASETAHLFCSRLGGLDTAPKGSAK